YTFIVGYAGRSPTYSNANREAPLQRLHGEPQNRRMRMTFRRALTVGGVAALLASAIAVAGAGAGPDGTPPGKGEAAPLGGCGRGHAPRRGGGGGAGRLRPRERQEGDGGADQACRPRHADPGRRLHDDR